MAQHLAYFPRDLRKVICLDCQGEFETPSRNALRCPKCRRQHDLARHKRAYYAQRACVLQNTTSQTAPTRGGVGGSNG